ncbi:MAG TPA: pilus assembly protein PilM [Nitrospirota bacterium]|nr:pilus assembly protein PilM [Nitrospirota bacterium]
MFRFVARKPALGIEISDSAVRLAALSRRGADLSLEYMKTADLPSGMVSAGYATLNILDASGLVRSLRSCLPVSSRPFRRSALSLPDSVFRVQVLDFDELPSKHEERDRLIRWRIEKTAAFDLAETVLRYQELPRKGRGFTVLVCVAKQAVIAQYETVLQEAGLEPWSIGISSFHILNFYSPLMTKKSTVFALTHLTEESFTTIIADGGGTRYYRYKELKRGSPAEIRTRLMREIDDSLHFYTHYTHQDRTQTCEVQQLYLAGESRLPFELAEGLSAASSLTVEVLSPDDIIHPSGRDGAACCPAVIAAALGAVSAL